MYSKKDIELFNDNIEQIKLDVQNDINEKIIPTLKDRKMIIKIIEKYIIDNKLKVYGGNAQNLAIKSVDPSKVFYINEDELHDFDIYSSEPLKDIINLCNLIYKEGFTNIRCVEAMHIETYSLKLEQYTFCDLTYMPKLIFNNVPFLEVDNLFIIHPHFAYIDFLRMFVDPYTSNFRWDQHFDRFNKMQEIFPFTKYEENVSLKKIGITDKIMDKNIHKIIREYAKSSDLITTGFDAYNKYYKLNKELVSDYIKKIPIQYIEFISSDYENDVIKLIETLKNKLTILNSGKSKKDKLNIKNIDINKNIEVGCAEKYQFFQFLDFSTEIYVNKVLVAKIYKNNNICVPYILINNRKYATFHFNLMWLLINGVYKRIYGNNDNPDDIINNRNIEREYKILVSHLLTMRNNYFKKYNLTFLDKSIFQDFIIQCSGIPLSSSELKTKIKNYHGFKYEPKNNKKINIDKFNYRNINGRYIKNSKKCKINID